MKTNKRFKIILSTLAITALVLTGFAPFFAYAEPEEGETEVEIAPSATYKDSRVPGTNGGAVILMNAENGDVIYERNSHQLREPASVTKILTCLIVVETLDLNQEVTVSKNVEWGGTSIDLVPGEKLTVEQLLYGMMLESGNDAAQLLAQTSGGDLKHFAEMMNKRARECGALDSTFKNPNGLNENAKTLNVTTVYDMAVITREALKNEDFRKIVSTVYYTIPKTNKSKTRKLKNSNACLWNDKRTAPVGDKNVPLKYPGCTGVKTGYTTAAGGCYVGSAKRDDMELIVVSFGSAGTESKYADAIALWNYGFKYYKTYTAMTQEDSVQELKVKKGALSKVRIGLAEDLDITLDSDNDSEDKITTKVKINEEEPLAPIKRSAVMGTVEAYDKNGKLIAVRDLLAMEKVEEGGPLSNIGIADEHAWIFTAAVVLVILILLLRCIRWRKAHPRPPKPKKQKPPKQKKTKAQKPKMKKKPAEQKVNASKEPEEMAPPETPAEPQYYFSPPSGREIAPPLSSEMAKLRESMRREPEAYRDQFAQHSDARRREIEAGSHRQAYRPDSQGEYAPRGERTKAEKRAIRKQRAKRRKGRQRQK